MIDATCWAFDKCPSELDDLFWQYSFADLKKKIGLKAQYEIAKLNQGYENLTLVVGAIFGGESGEVIDDLDAAMAFGSRMG